MYGLEKQSAAPAARTTAVARYPGVDNRTWVRVAAQYRPAACGGGGHSNSQANSLSFPPPPVCCLQGFLPATSSSVSPLTSFTVIPGEKNSIASISSLYGIDFSSS